MMAAAYPPWRILCRGLPWAPGGALEASLRPQAGVELRRVPAQAAPIDCGAHGSAACGARLLCDSQLEVPKILFDHSAVVEPPVTLAA